MSSAYGYFATVYSQEFSMPYQDINVTLSDADLKEIRQAIPSNIWANQHFRFEILVSIHFVKINTMEQYEAHLYVRSIPQQI